MTKRWIVTIASMTILPACGDATAVVASLSRPSPQYPDAGSTQDAGQTTDSGNTDVGPVEVTWALYEEGKNSEANWDPAKPNTAGAVSVVASKPMSSRAGLRFDFADGKMHDLSNFEQVVVNLDVTVGDRFEVFLGRGPVSVGPSLGCSYVFTKGVDSRYAVNLASASWCVPSQCGFDLQVDGGYVLAYVPDDSQLSATVYDLRFTSGVPAGSASALGGAKGPNDFCWFIANWKSKTAIPRFVTAPTSSSVRVQVAQMDSDTVGMAFEIPSGFKLGQYRTFVLDATVSGGSSQANTTFFIQAVKLEQGLGWTLSGDGKRQSYRIDLTAPAFTFGGPVPLSLDSVERIEIVGKASGNNTTLDALVQGVDFQ